MITKERLEELIKEGATIWTVGRYSFQDKIEEIKLDKDFFSVSNSALIYPDLFYTKFEDLFETQKQAEWYLKYHATRTEELDLPMWEDVEDKHYFKRFCVNNNVYTLYVGNFGETLLERDTIQILRNKHFNGRNVLIGTIFKKPKNKLNYLRACDLCLKLFKGEEK